MDMNEIPLGRCGISVVARMRRVAIFRSHAKVAMMRPVRASPVAIELMRTFDWMDGATSCFVLFCGMGMAVVDLAHRSAWEERERRGYLADSEDDDGDDDS